MGTSEVKEYEKSSKTLNYTPLGSPHAPKLRVNSVGEQTALMEWICESYPKQEFIKGFRLLVNSEHSQLFDKDVNKFELKDMQPGKEYSIQIVTLTDTVVPESKPSNSITLVCPLRPNSPLIHVSPSIRPNSAAIEWKPVEPKTDKNSDRVVSYK